MNAPNYQLLAFGMKIPCGNAIFSLLILLSCFSLTAQQLAFPSANGAGAYVTGGRGGSVYHVTNLNNSGSGSFRDAVSGSNRTIVFDVSGTIELSYDLTITSDNLTIAGQTAPEGGITITGSFVHIQNNENIILRYLRFRPNYDSSGSVDALNAYNCRDMIVDHCSVSWGGDEAFSLRGTSADVTIKNCIFAESATGMLAGESGNASSDNFSVIGNLWYNISHRFPNVNVTRTDVINNVVHNWYSRLMVVSNRDGARLNEINNFYQKGITTSTPPYSVNWLDIGYASQRSNIRVYTAGNVYPSVLTEDGDNWDLYVHRFNISSGAYAGTSQWDPGNTDFRSATQFAFLGEAPEIMTAEEALAYVPLNAGANKYFDNNGNVQTAWDTIDNTYVTHVINNTSEYFSYPPTAIVSKQSYIDFHNSVSNTPINSRPSSYDTDNDGMADVWEMNTYSTLSHNGTADSNNNGYTDLEEFINGVDAQDPTGNQVTVSSNDNDDTICQGQEIILTAADANNYVWDNNGETSTSITVTPNVTTTYTVTGTHSDGSTTEAEITVTVIPSPNSNAGEDTVICSGEDATLTASGGTSYEWSTGETTPSITVSPSNTTTYTVEVTQNGCSSSDDVVVTVNPMPDVYAGVDQTIFEGETATLTATGADTYLWSTGETSASITVNPLSDTSYSVTGTIGICQKLDTVTVFLLDDSVSANAGEDAAICQGETTTITASGGTTYLWNTGETTSSIDVTPSTTTTYTVTAFSPSGNNQDQDDIIVTVNNLPNADAGTTTEICFGYSAVLTASGGSSYLWSTGETTESITVAPDDNTMYSVEVFEGNCSNTANVEVIVKPLPIVNAGDDVTIIEGESTTLTASGGDTYMWDSGETTQSITVSPTETTIYSVKGFVNGCEASDDVVVTVIMDEANANAGDDVEICFGESTTLTATGGTTYLWNTGETTASIDVTPTTTTTYTVTAFSPSGNNQDQDDVLVTVNALPIADAGEDTEICFGNSAILSASGGTSYLWSTGETTQDITVSPTNDTVYSVDVFDGTCTATDDVLVTVIELPSVNAGEDTMIYDGESTTITATGADTYLWNTGETTQSITVSPTDTTTYTVTGFSNTCEATDDVIVTVLNDDVAANAGNDVEICFGETTTLTASGGTTYLWNTGETTASIDVSPTNDTTYTVTAFSPSGNNQDQDDVLVTVNALPTADAGEDTEICFGTSTTLSASGGTSYLWSTGETSQNITVSPTNNTVYSVDVFDGTCTATDDVLVTVIELPSVNAGEDTMIYDGESTTLTATGANTYLWNTGETTQSITVSPTDTTTYTVTGFSNTCEATDDVIVTVLNDDVAANAGDDVEICFGETTTLTASGGTTYLWNTGETTASIDVTPTTTTTYTVTAFSPSGNNQDQDDVLVTVNALPIADAGEDTEICFGTSTTLSASGGTSYLWSTGETSQNITVSPTNNTVYSVDVFDGTCTATDDVLVTVIELPSVNAGEDTMIYDGESTTITATGADTYLWNTGETTQSITVSPTDTTTYTVTGFSNTCEATDDVIVTVLNDDVAANAGDDVEICFGETTTLTASGGTTYLWNTGETTASIDVSPTDDTTYTVTAFSPSGNNQDQDDVLVTVNALPIADAGEDTEICLGTSTTLSASGGTSYLWSTGETTQNITVSPTNNTVYSVDVFDGTCTASDDVLVTIIALPSVDAGENVGILEGETTTLTASGADTYLWSTGETTESISVSPSETTTYTVTGFLNGCEANDDVTVEIITETVIAEILGGDFSICEGTTVILTASGGASYLWSTGETTTSIEVSPSETIIYTVTAFSPSGNSQDDDSITITVNEVPLANAGADATICLGESTVLTASGGTSYLWNTGETAASISVSPSETTSYSVEVFNENCSSVDDVLVTINPLPNVNAGNDITISEGDSTTLTATGADSYLWSTGETTSSIEVSPNSSTTYTVTGFINGCEASDNVIVTVEIENVTANAGNDVEICNGESTILTASGGTTYLWNTGETTASITVSPNTTTTFTVTAFNTAQSASDEDSVMVTVNELPATNAGVDVTISEGESTTLIATGADTYLWNTGETTASIDVAPNTTTTYSVTGFSNGCETTDEITVTVTIETVSANAGNDVDICNGESTVLTATGGSSYLWNTGETSANITVSPSATTTYTVTAFNSTQTVSDEDSVTVTVNELPTTNAGADVTIFDGEATTLTATGADTYLWNTGETTASIDVAPNTTTTYSVTGFSNDCETSGNVTVTVEPSDFEASAGENRTICEGYDTILTASSGDSYLWSTGETTQSITVNPATTQTYSVTVFQGENQGSANVTVEVDPNPDVVISNGDDLTILEGEFVTLSASGADSYLWNNGATQPNIAVSPSITTNYEVTGYTNDCEATRAVMVNVVGHVIADAGQDVIICSDETVTLTATGGEEYLWDTGETTQSIEVSPDVDTEYSVLVYNDLDSDEDTVKVFVEECTTVEGPEYEEGIGFLVYQNPETDILKIRIDGLQSFVAKGFSIYDVTGNVLYSETFDQTELENLSQMTREIKTDVYATGIYMVKIKYDDTSLVKKIPIN